MRSKRLTFLLLAGIAAALAAAMLPAAGAAASPASAARQSSAAPTVIAHKVSGCGPEMTVYTPSKPGAPLPGATLGLATGPHSLLARAAQRHVRWLSTITCRSRRVPTLRMPLTGRAAADSGNWSGYVDSTSSPDYAQASWQIPTACCDSEGADLSSIWAGIGSGSTAGTSLIQDGTEQDVSTSDVASYYFWFETAPQQDQEEVTNLTAHPGDDVSVSSSYDTLVSGDATFVICDFTEGVCGDASEASDPPDNHAEWIVERTAYCNTSAGVFWLPALTSFSVAEFTGSYYDLDADGDPAFTISQGSPTEYLMEDVDGETMATPGSLGSGGTAFNVVWNDYGVPSEFLPATAC